MSTPAPALQPRSRGRTPRAYAPSAELALPDERQMSPIVETEPLASDVLAHLDIQIASVRGLLEIVLEQGAAIRARDVHEVVRLAGMLNGELARRQQIESTRSQLLERAAAQLGIPVQAVTLTRLTVLMDPAHAKLAIARSAHLRGLVEELRREHSCNRALMQIELSFLDHLMKSLSLDASPQSYDPRGSRSTGASSARHGALRVLDLQA
jgi:6,7-dimethyl-8-ribityllumazine synthase